MDIFEENCVFKSNAGRPSRVSADVIEKMKIVARNRDLRGRSYMHKKIYEFGADLYAQMQAENDRKGNNGIAMIKLLSPSLLKKIFLTVCPDTATATHRNAGRSIALGDIRNAISFAVFTLVIMEGIDYRNVGNLDDIGVILNTMGDKPTLVRLAVGSKPLMRERNLSAGCDDPRGKQRVVHIGTQLYPDGLNCVIFRIHDHNFVKASDSVPFKPKIQRFQVYI